MKTFILCGGFGTRLDYEGTLMAKPMVRIGKEPILNLDSKKLAVTPISPFRPRRWKGIIVSDKSKILIKNLDVNKRPISAVADNFEVRNAKTIEIQANKKICFELLYDKNNSLHKKIKIEQTRKETSNN